MRNKDSVRPYCHYYSYYFFIILTPSSSSSSSSASLPLPPDPGSMTNLSGREERQGYPAQRLVLGGCERAVYPGGHKFQAGGLNAPFIFPEGLSSIETLLTNIQVRLQADCRAMHCIIIIIIIIMIIIIIIIIIIYIKK